MSNPALKNLTVLVYLSYLGVRSSVEIEIGAGSGNPAFFYTPGTTEGELL